MTECLYYITLIRDKECMSTKGGIKTSTTGEVGNRLGIDKDRREVLKKMMVYYTEEPGVDSFADLVACLVDKGLTEQELIYCTYLLSKANSTYEK